MHGRALFLALFAVLFSAANASRFARPIDILPHETFQLVAFPPEDEEVTWSEYCNYVPVRPAPGARLINHSGDLLMQEDKSAPCMHTYLNDTLRVTRDRKHATRWRFDDKTGSVYTYVLDKPYALALGARAKFRFLRSRKYARIALTRGIGSGTPFFFTQIEGTKNVLRYRGADKSRLTMCKEHAKDTTMVLVRRPLQESKLRYCEDLNFAAKKVKPGTPFEAGKEFPP